MIKFEPSKYEYKSNKKIAQCRHGNTKYDDYDVFFNVFLGNRQKLNWNCYQFLNEEISTAEFVSAQNDLVREVNLNRKEVQKRLYNKYLVDLREINPEASNSYIKNTAKQMIRNLITNQMRRNLKRANREKLYFIEDESDMNIMF
ncbi:MAG: hypothetical protein IKZ49_02005 [Alphaproteobacteria bacterium]|nr:hypothetical protein [Alphaproteobacteria bacterium]